MIGGVAWKTQPPPLSFVTCSRKKLLRLVIDTKVTIELPKGNGEPGTGCQLTGGVRLKALISCQPVKLVGQEISATPGVRIEMFKVGGTWAEAAAATPTAAAMIAAFLMQLMSFMTFAIRRERNREGGPFIKLEIF